MKNLIIICSLLSIFSCENKTLTENDIQKILDSSKVYNEYTLKKNFKIETINNKLDSKVLNSNILQKNFKSYYIADFNKDGYKDYLVNLDLKPKKDSSIILIRPIDEYKNFVILDVDQYRGMCRNSQVILAKYPELYSDITDKAVGMVMNRIITDAINEGYNFIFEGNER